MLSITSEKTLGSLQIIIFLIINETTVFYLDLERFKNKKTLFKNIYFYNDFQV